MQYVVTGANRGLGLEFTRQLSDRGDSVVATARRPSEAEALNELAADPDRAVDIFELDVTDASSVDIVGEATAGLEIDVLINNAGRLTEGGSPNHFDFEQIRGDFEVNAVGTLRVVEALLGGVRRGGGGKIVNVTSKMGSIADNGSGGSYAYRMSKCALNMATRSLAIDLEDDGIVAFVIHPGWVQTRMGGDEALITAETSVRNMVERIDAAGADEAGAFLEWDGGTIPW